MVYAVANGISKMERQQGLMIFLLKHLRQTLYTTVELLYPLFGKIWEEEAVPSDWKEGYLIKLPKKGDQ